MASTRGRQVVVPWTNKTGNSVAAGDVVIVDTANDEAFTTTTTSRSETTIGIAQETIANNGTGRVLVAGRAALVNVPASVTRGHYIETHTVAKQATGSSTRRSGSFGQFLTGGTSPAAVLWGSTDQTATASASSSVIGSAFLQHASVDTTVTGFGTAMSDMDATNLAAAFTVPSSGNVMVSVEALVAQAASVTTAYLGVRESSSTLKQAIATQLGSNERAFARWKITGLTPAASLTYKAAIGKSSSGTMTFYHGPTFGSASIVVESLP